MKKIISFVCAISLLLLLVPAVPVQTAAASASLTELDSALLQDNAAMNNTLAVNSVRLADACYDGQEAMKGKMNALGFEVLISDYSECTFGEDHVAYTLARKKVLAGGEAFFIYALAIRGTNGVYEWISNLAVEGNLPFHGGFAGAANNLFSAVEKYITTPKEKNILWVTGHSRGAAVANYFAGAMMNGNPYVPEKSIHAYTFACPSVTKKPNKSQNIYNFNFREDIVPQVPLASWGYGVHGRVYMASLNDWVEGNCWSQAEMNKIITRAKMAFPNEDIYSALFNHLMTYEKKALLTVADIIDKGDWASGVSSFLENLRTTSEALVIYGNFVNGTALSALLVDFIAHKNYYGSSIFIAHTPESYVTWIEGAYGPTYLSRCKEFSCNVTVEVTTDNTWLMSLPCSNGTDSSSSSIRKGISGEKLTATKVYRNSEGNYWYEIRNVRNSQTGKTQTAYLYSGDTVVKSLYWGSVRVQNATKPKEIRQGNWFALRGTVSASNTELTRVRAYIKTPNGDVCFEYGVGVTGSYKLDGSALDTAMMFDKLSAGNYTYELWADVANYTASHKTLEKNEKKVLLLSQPFAVINPQPVFYKVYLNGGASGHNQSITVAGGTKIGKIPSASYMGHFFEGWYTDPEGGYRVDENLVITGNTTLYARFTPLKYEINLMLDQDSFFQLFAVRYGSQFGELPTPSRSGLVFDGWYTAADGGQQVTSSTYLYAGENEVDLPIQENNLTFDLYAHWSIATDRGVCGENLTWEINELGNLIISGFGAMYNYSSSGEVPWDASRDVINWISMPVGMTTISSYAFSSMPNLYSVEIPYTVWHVGDSAFAYCENLYKVYYYGTEASLHKDDYCFRGCDPDLAIYTTCTHKYSKTEVPPTCVDEGYDLHVCSKCGGEYRDNSVPATGIHAYVYLAEENRIIETCVNGCNHRETATVKTAADKYFFLGESVDPASVQYTDNWHGGELEITYTDNDAPGIATASISLDGAAAYVNFTLVIPENLVEGAVGDNLTWAIREDGILFIEGNGDMPEWESSASVPWLVWEKENHKNFRIRNIVVSGEITSIGAHAFQNLDDVQSVTLPDSITSIGTGAFWGCYDLASIDLPENLEQIHEKAFWCCESLQELILPNSVTAIWDRAFERCDAIKSITLGASMKIVSSSSFDSMYSLEEILVDEDNRYYTSVDGVLYTKDMRSLTKYPQNKTEETFQIPSSVERIDWYAFGEAQYLQEVHIPYTVRYVGNSAFYNCYNLSAAWFYGDAPSFGLTAFIGSPNVVIYYPEGNDNWPSGELSTYTQKPFSCRHSGEEQTANPTCVEPGYSGLVCMNCGEILEVYSEYPATGIHDLGYSTSIDYCTDIDTITELCRACNHRATAEISVPEQYLLYTGKAIEPAVVRYSETWLGGELVVTYENNMEAGEASASIRAGDAVASVLFYIEAEENLAHGVCGDNLTWVVSSDGTMTIRGNGDMYDYTEFYYAPWSGSCDGYPPTRVIIEDGVTSIGSYAFATDWLVQITIPDSVVRIGEGAFEMTTYLESIDLPPSLREVPASAFRWSGLERIVIPDGVTTIGAQAFRQCWYLTDVTLPESLLEIQEHAFSQSGVQFINLPTMLRSIGESAFSYAELKEVHLPLDVTIGDYAFYGGAEKIYVCTGDLSRVGTEAFGDDEDTVTLYYAEAASEWGQQKWEGVITVPWKNEDHAPLTRNVPPNGCEKGYTFHYCERCGNGYKTDFVDGVAPHVLSYYSSGKTIVETCENGCGHKETATLVLPLPYYAYTEEEITPVILEYSDGWQGGHATIRYQDNCDPGTATAYAEYETATAEIQFTITETPIVAFGVCGDDLMWRLEESGLFVISGTGPMYDYVWWPEDESEPFLPEWYSEDMSEDIRELVIEEGVTSIGDFAFSACVNLEHISFPESLQCIGMCAFSGNYALRSILLPDSLTEIREEAFYGCDSVRALSINEKLTSVGEYAFACGDPDSMIISFASTREAWESISGEPGVFWMDSDDILYQSFCGVQAESITWVYNRETKALTIDGSKTILRDPDRFYSEDWAGFRSEVEILSIGANLHDVGKGYENVYYRDNWFAGFTNLSEATVAEDNTHLMSRDGILYDADQKILLLCPARKTHVTIPASVERLEAFAFEDCDALEQVVFEGEPPHTSIAFGHTPFPKSPNVEVLYYVDTPGWDFDPWFTPWINYKCTGISRLTTPEIQRTEGGISFQIDTSSWSRCDKPRVVVCAVYDEAGRMLGLDMVEVTYSEQQMSVNCDTNFAAEGILFVFGGWNSLIPAMPSLPFAL